MTAQEKTFSVAIKAVVVRGDGKMLTMRRGATAPTDPLGWDLPGGILEHGEEPDQGVIRETLEETGLTIESPRAFHAIARPNLKDEYWVNIYYAAQTTSEDVVLSFEHDEFKWIAPEEFQLLEATKGKKETVAVFIALRDAGKL